MLTIRAASCAPRGARGLIGARGARALRVAAFALATGFALAAAAHEARAQFTSGGRAVVGGPGGQNSISGEFKVDESKAGNDVPHSFVLVLTNELGKIIDRQNAMNNSRFTFNGLRNGTYDITIEAAGLPVARVGGVVIESSGRGEVKQDIFLQWDNIAKSNAAKAGTLSAADFYDRPAANRDLFEKASLALRKKKYGDAAAMLQQIVGADEKDHVAWAYLGSAESGLGNAQEAGRCYERALALAPGMLSAAVNLGRLRLVGKDYAGALEVLRPAAEKHPDSADAHFLLGEACLQTGDNEEAITHFREALRLDPKKDDARLRLAALLDAAGRKGEAAAELEQFLAKHPDHPNRERFEQYIAKNRKK
jgi:tetratricopeptide (TPR) repeat protein